MYVCKCVCMYVCMCVCVYVCACVYVCMCKYVHVWMHMWICMWVCRCMCMYVSASVRLYLGAFGQCRRPFLTAWAHAPPHQRHTTDLSLKTQHSTLLINATGLRFMKVDIPEYQDLWNIRVMHESWGLWNLIFLHVEFDSCWISFMLNVCEFTVLGRVFEGACTS